MKVLILGDNFIKEEIVKDKLRTALRDIDDLEFISAVSNWPLAPFQNNDEIAEYEGSEEIIKSLIKDVDVVIVHAAPISESILNEARNLKAIGVARGGPKNINLEAATKRGIPVFNTPGRNAVAVVEFTVGLILAELKNIARAHSNMVQGNWRYDYYLYDQCKFELTDRVMGLIGFGNIACKLSTIMKAFGMKVVSFDPYAKLEKMQEYGVEKVSFDKLLEISDIVSVHARLTEETKEMFNMNVFEKMKRSALFVNTARGGLVNYEDLANALASGEISCAAIDVYENEPVDFHSKIMKCKNVTFTPHIAGATTDAAHYGLEMLTRDISNFLKGNSVKNCINPEVLK